MTIFQIPSSPPSMTLRDRSSRSNPAAFSKPIEIVPRSCNMAGCSPWRNHQLFLTQRSQVTSLIRWVQRETLLLQTKLCEHLKLRVKLGSEAIMQSAAVTDMIHVAFKEIEEVEDADICEDSGADFDAPRQDSSMGLQGANRRMKTFILAFVQCRKSARTMI